MPEQIPVSEYHLAEMAETIALTLDRVAATYRRMAEGDGSPDKTARLLGHVARLKVRADHERDEAARLRFLGGR